MTKPEEHQILVVEDDIDISDTLGHLLEEEGYLVRIAENGVEALHILRTGDRPSLVLLDLMMPKMNGRQFLEEVGLDSSLQALAIVVMSANVPADLPLTWVRDVMKKPVDLDHFLDVIRRNVLRAQA